MRLTLQQIKDIRDANDKIFKILQELDEKEEVILINETTVRCRDYLYKIANLVNFNDGCAEIFHPFEPKTTIAKVGSCLTAKLNHEDKTAIIL